MCKIWKRSKDKQSFLRNPYMQNYKKKHPMSYQGIDDNWDAFSRDMETPDGDKGVAVLPKILRFLKVPTEPDFRAFGHKVSSEVSTFETLRVQFER